MAIATEEIAVAKGSVIFCILPYKNSGYFLVLTTKQLMCPISNTANIPAMISPKVLPEIIPNND